MKICSALLLGVSVFFTGCATSPTRQALSSAGRVALVAHFPPEMRGIVVSTKAFENRPWEGVSTGIDANAAAILAAKTSLSREIHFANGRELSLPTDVLRVDPEQGFPANFDHTGKDIQVEIIRSRLAELGREWRTDVILLLTMREGSSRTGQLHRLSLMATRQMMVAGHFTLHVFDCRIDKFVGMEQEWASQQVDAEQWHDTWTQFSESEKQKIAGAWDDLPKSHSAPPFKSRPHERPLIR